MFMSLFPTYIEEELETEEQSEKIIAREYEINFNTGEFTGNIVEGLEAIKVWIWLALKTTRYRHVIYSWDYGNELEDLIGVGDTEEFIKAEAERMIEDALLVNENITSITEIEVTKENDKIFISFTANTIYGEVEINV